MILSTGGGVPDLVRGGVPDQAHPPTPGPGVPGPGGCTWSGGVYLVPEGVPGPRQ